MNFFRKNPQGSSPETPHADTMGWRFPSPWIGSFSCEAEFLASQAATPQHASVFAYIDDQLVASRHPRIFPAYCCACGSIQEMRIDWALGGPSGNGSIHPAWTETSTCSACGMNSRMRAVLAHVLDHGPITEQAECYLAERLTVSFNAFAKVFPKLTTSEFLGPDRTPGESVFVARHATKVRHEDLTRLSFKDQSFDWVITQDVFEHVPDFAEAFRQCARVLRPEGRLVFTVPFSSALSKTQIRARLRPDGAIEHLLPPEIHGNPIDGNGSLCFQNFGWDILDTLRTSGFREATANFYWGPWSGHIGIGAVVFSAKR